jgi:hypothetical protein
MMSRAVSNIDEAILMRRSGVMSSALKLCVAILRILPYDQINFDRAIQMHEIEHSLRARSRSLIILRTSSSSVMTRSLKDLIPRRSHQRDAGIKLPSIGTYACKYLIYQDKFGNRQREQPLNKPIIPIGSVDI